MFILLQESLQRISCSPIGWRMIIITSGRSTGDFMNISGIVVRWGWDMRESGEKQGARGKEQGVMAKKAKEA